MREFSSITSELQRLQTSVASPARAHLVCVERQIAALSRGDFAAVLADATDDVTLEIFAPSELPFVRQASGKAALLEAITANFQELDEQVPVIDKVLAEGDRVILFSRETGVVKRTGFRYDVEVVHWFTFRHERLASVQITAALTKPAPVLVRQSVSGARTPPA